jgi:hypothetical protein
MDSNKKRIVIIIFISALLNLTACSYSFNGASIPPHIKNIAIPLIPDKSGSGEFDLGNNLTTLLTQQFIDDNSLRVSNGKNPDSILEGSIISLNDAPAVISGGQATAATVVATRRITISVHIVYKDLVKKQTILETNFTNYSDYNSSGVSDITTGRKTAISKALGLISEDIVLGVVSNW